MAAQHGGDRTAGALLQIVDDPLDAGGGVCCVVRQLTHLVGHHGKATPLFAGAGRLDGGVEGQQIGLLRDALSQALQKVAEQSSRIASATLQQQQTSAEIARNITNIARIADDNQGALAKVAQTSDQLQQLSQQQLSLTRRFTLQLSLIHI